VSGLRSGWRSRRRGRSDRRRGVTGSRRAGTRLGRRQGLASSTAHKLDNELPPIEDLGQTDRGTVPTRAGLRRAMPHALQR